jgi:hypothetical protein
MMVDKNRQMAMEYKKIDNKYMEKQCKEGLWANLVDTYG